MGAPRLRAGTRLRADDGTTYAVERPLVEGGFGQTYVGQRLSARGNAVETVCIKVCASRRDWHGEAFFGELLAGDDRVVRLHDAFVATTRSGNVERRRHVLVFDFLADGTVWDMVERGEKPWTEARTRREIRALLGVLTRLHVAGATHRDLKPDNVFLRDRRLVLGDFGITRMNLDPQQAPGHVSSFAEDFAPADVLTRARWAQADDVYQVGLLAGTLLSAEIWWAGSVSLAAITALPVSDGMKSWLWHATGARSKRYLDAAAAADALDSLRRTSLAPGRAPRTIRGHTVVFTGRIDGVPRRRAFELATAAGAHPRPTMTDSTTMLVVGRVRAGSAGAQEDLKLFETRERLRLGQPIRIVSADQFVRLAAGPGAEA